MANDKIIKWAKGISNLGISVLALNGEKVPIKGHGWKNQQAEQLSELDINDQFGQDICKGIGVIGGRVSKWLEFMDFDIPDKKERQTPECYEPFLQMVADHDLTEVVESCMLIRTPSGGKHLIYRWDGEPGYFQANQEEIKKYGRSRKLAYDEFCRTLIEVKADGGYVATYPSPGYTIERGEWAKLPTLTAEQRDCLHKIALSLDRTPEDKKSHLTRNHRDRTPEEWHYIHWFLDHHSFDIEDRLTREGWTYHGPSGSARAFRRPGQPKHHPGGNLSACGNWFYCFTTNAFPLESDENYGRFDVWCAYDQDRNEAKAFQALRDMGCPEYVPYKAKPKEPTVTVSQVTGEPRAYNFTDLGNAERMVDQHAENLKYCPVLKRFYYWGGAHWRYDITDTIAKQKAVETVLDMTKKADSLHQKDAEALINWSRKCESNDKISSMVSLFKTRPAVAVESDAFDSDKMLFNVQNGTLDLKTGKLLPHSKTDLITRSSPVTYDQDAECPLWESFLEVVLPNQEVRLYVQKALGYSLTGNVHHQCFYFTHGSGRNGKSTMLETIMFIMGTYGKVLKIEALYPKMGGSGADEEIARLDGARFVLTSETQKGRILNENLFKDITGGDTINARFLYSNSFDFKPQCKVWMRGNHKPGIKGTDNGIWRRMKLIDFGVQIPEEDMDAHLAEKLLEEAPGILNWMLEGLMLEQWDGLKEPQIMLDAVKEYREQMDAFGEFLNAYISPQEYKWVRVHTLKEKYTDWINENGGEKMGQYRFTQELKSRQYAFGETIKKRRSMLDGWGWLDPEHGKADEKDEEEPFRKDLDY